MKEQTEELKLIYQINHSYYPNIDSFISKVIDFVEVYYRTKENTIISNFLFKQCEMNEIIIGDIVNKFEMKEVLIFDFQDFPLKSDLIESVKNTCTIFYNKFKNVIKNPSHAANIIGDIITSTSSPFLSNSASAPFMIKFSFIGKSVEPIIRSSAI